MIKRIVLTGLALLMVALMLGLFALFIPPAPITDPIELMVREYVAAKGIGEWEVVGIGDPIMLDCDQPKQFGSMIVFVELERPPSAMERLRRRFLGINNGLVLQFALTLDDGRVLGQVPMDPKIAAVPRPLDLRTVAELASASPGNEP
jgi:hypothetical protein